MSITIKKIAAVYCVFEDKIFLEYSIRSILGFANKIIISVNHKAWQSGEPLTFDYYNYLLALQKKYNKIEILKCYVKNQSAQRNYALEVLKNQGFDYCFVIDADEFYTKEHLHNIKRIIFSNPEIGLFRIYWRNYWHSFRYIIEPDEPSEPVCFIKIGAAAFKISRYAELIDNSHKAYTFKKDEAVCHHFSYALSNIEVAKKIRRFSASFEILPDWFFNIWLEWENNHEIQDLHPVHPWHYKKTIKTEDIPLPEILKDHPFFDMEIINEQKFEYNGLYSKEINFQINKLSKKISEHKITKIFIIGPDFYNLAFMQIIESIKLHLEYTGIDAYIYSISDMKIYFNFRNGDIINNFLQSDDINLLLCHLQTEILKFAPEIIIDFWGAPNLLCPVIKKYIGVINVFWFLNSFNNTSSIWLNVLKKYDAYFTIETDFPAQLNNSGAHMDFNKIYFGKPINMGMPDYSIEKEYDIIFFGNYSAENLDLLENLQEFSLVIFGRNWENKDTHNFKLINFSGSLYELSDICNKSRLVIYKIEKNDVDLMSFVAGTNTLVTISKSFESKYQFSDIDNIFYYSDIEELKKFLTQLSTIPKEKALNIIKTGNQKIFRRSSMFNTIDFLLDKIIYNV